MSNKFDVNENRNLSGGNEDLERKKVREAAVELNEAAENIDGAKDSEETAVSGKKVQEMKVSEMKIEEMKVQAIKIQDTQVQDIDMQEAKDSPTGSEYAKSPVTGLQNEEFATEAQQDDASDSEQLLNEEEQRRLEEEKERETLREKYKEVTKVKKRKQSFLAKILGGTSQTRSLAGTLFLFFIVLIFAIFSLFPVIFMVGNAFKPLSELFRFPPSLLPDNPTFENFKDLAVYASQSFVPFLRYLFNTLLVVLLGCAGMVVFSAMAAFPLAKFHFKGRKFLSKLIEWALLFTAAVLAVPTYLIVAKLGLIDTYFAIILPSWGSTLGLYLLQNFMSQVPDSLIEAASIDGASPFKMLWRIIMPAVKPAWITVFIFSFQALWGNTGGSFIYKEQMKPLSYMLGQIASAGIARAGVASATSLIMFIIPVLVFIISQSNILETMTTSGMKE